MNCEQAQSFRDPYLDSELDARTTLELEQHLKSCPECARSFADEQKLEAWIITGLKRGQKSVALWEQIEDGVRGSSVAEKSAISAPRVVGGSFWQNLGAAIGARLRTSWRKAPVAWSSLAAAWLVILVLNLAAHETETVALPGQATPSASVLRLAMGQRHQALAELALPTVPPVASGRKRPVIAPRSQRDEHMLRT